MDALRRAEEEKRRSEERAAGSSGDGAAPAATPTPQSSDPGGLSLELQPMETPPAAATASGMEAEGESAWEEPETTSRSQPLHDPASGAAQVEGLEGTRETLRSGIPDDDATLPTDRALRSSLREYFDASQSLSMSQSHTEVLTNLREGNTSPNRVAPAVADDPTPQSLDYRTGASQRVSAQAVLTAARRTTTSRVVTLLAAGLFIVTTALGAIGFFYFNRSLSAPQILPSPRVAQGIDRASVVQPVLPPVLPVPAPPLPAPLPEPGPVTPDAMGSPVATAGPASAAVSVAPSAVPPVEAADTAPAPAAELGTPVEEPTPDSTTAAVATASPPAPAVEAPGLPAATPAAAVTPPVTVPSAVAEEPPAAPPASAPLGPLLVAPDGAAPIASAVHISRARKPAGIDPNLMAAYSAWRAGSVSDAEALYRKVLSTQPNNRDALLGIAAVAVSRGDVRTAEQIYQRVLNANPRDTLASAGLYSLRGGENPGIDASRLKLLLDEEPSAGHLHFALGNRHASESRWRDAQAAYFEAVRMDVENPDYVYNLAVSLDRIGGQAAAIQYYQQALRLAQKRKAVFDRAQAESRLRWLERQARP